MSGDRVFVEHSLYFLGRFIISATKESKHMTSSSAVRTWAAGGAGRTQSGFSWLTKHFPRSHLSDFRGNQRLIMNSQIFLIISYFLETRSASLAFRELALLSFHIPSGLDS